MIRRVITVHAFILICLLVYSPTSLFGQDPVPDQMVDALAKIRELGGSVDLHLDSHPLERKQRRISMMGKRFCDDSLRLIQDLGARPIQLFLDNSSVTDAGLEYLASNEFDNLKIGSISVQNTKISDYGLQFLHSIKGLQSVNLRGF